MIKTEPKPEPDNFVDAVILHRLNEQDAKLDRILRILDGNGEPGNGLVVRINNVERDIGFARWVSVSAFGAVIVAFVGWVWSQVNKGGPTP